MAEPISTQELDEIQARALRYARASAPEPSLAAEIIGTDVLRLVEEVRRLRDALALWQGRRPPQDYECALPGGLPVHAHDGPCRNVKGEVLPPSPPTPPKYPAARWAGG